MKNHLLSSTLPGPREIARMPSSWRFSFKPGPWRRCSWRSAAVRMARRGLGAAVPCSLCPLQLLTQSWRCSCRGRPGWWRVCAVRSVLAPSRAVGFSSGGKYGSGEPAVCLKPVPGPLWHALSWSLVIDFKHRVYFLGRTHLNFSF